MPGESRTGDKADPQDKLNQSKLNKVGLVITLKESTGAVLKPGWHCIDFDREGWREGQTAGDRPPPHHTPMKPDVHNAFVTMNREAQAESNRRWHPPSKKSPSGGRFKGGPRRPQP